MTATCKNCGNGLTGKYCYECGQPASTHQINSHFLWHDIQHGLLHFDKGILFSAKELFTRPGATIREYMEGRRVSHLKPLSMLILLATVYGLLYHLLDISPAIADFGRGLNSGMNTGKTTTPFRFDLEAVNTWIGTHFALVTLVQLPFYALASWLAFRKSGYNYVEHIVLNAFLASQRLMVGLVFLPLEYFFNRTNGLLYISSLTSIINVVLLVWGYTTFFHRYSTGKAIGLSLLAQVLVLVLFVVAMLLVGTAIGLGYTFLHRH